MERRLAATSSFVIAGPCSVESENRSCARRKRWRRPGRKLLRGGAFKPRTSPYDFQGMEEEGLKLLQKAKKATGLAIVTEVNGGSRRRAGGQSTRT